MRGGAEAPGTRGGRLGLVLVAGAAMLFASKGLFAKLLYARGVSFEALVTVRAVLAMPLFAWIAWRGSVAGKAVAGDDEAANLAVTPAARRPPTAAVVAAVLAGVVGYYVGALVDFWALTMIDASVERVLLFSYPAMVVMINAVLKRAIPSRSTIVAVLVAWLGIWFAMGGVDLHVLTANLFGAALVLVAALTTAIYFLIGERYTHALGSARFAAIAMCSAAVMLAGHFLIFRSTAEFGPYDAYVWSLLTVLALACMFIPGLMQAEGVRRVGAETGAIASTVGPPTTIVLAALFFDERLNFWQVLGSAMIVGSVLVMSLRKKA
jgi:drug/metabolite transporter (DMT)-like permease